MNYEHVVYIATKEDGSYLAIDRLLADGRREFMTHFPLPATTGDDEGFDLMAKAANWLGNSICIDSPAFREHIGINEAP